MTSSPNDQGKKTNGIPNVLHLYKQALAVADVRQLIGVRQLAGDRENIGDTARSAGSRYSH